MKKLLVLLVLLILFIPNLYSSDLVYALNYYDGISYNNKLILPSNDEIYIISNSQNSIVCRETELYYWDLTSEYKADWSKLNKVIGEKLVIELNGSIFRELKLDDYVVQYDLKDIKNTLNIYWGENSKKAFNKFKSNLNEYNNLLRQYRKDLEKYNKNLLTSYEKPPIPPKEFTLLSTNLNKGFPLNLPEGKYKIYVKDLQNKKIKGSERKLIVFSKKKDINGYKIFDYNRWTVPEIMADNNYYIYTKTDSNIFIEHYTLSMFNKKYYSLLKDPNNKNINYNDIEYVLGNPIKNPVKIDNTFYGISSYKVKQLEGSKLGYIINETDDENPSFYAANISNLEKGKYRLGNTNRIIVLESKNTINLLLVILSLLPLFIGLLVFLILKKRRGKKYG